MRQDRIEVFARDTAAAVAQRRQRILDRMRALGDRRLAHHAGGALQRMGEAQQPLHYAGVTAGLLQFENALRKLIEQVARLGAEITVRILCHVL